MVAGKFRPRQVCGKSGLCLRAELSAERTVLSFMEQALLGACFVYVGRCPGSLFSTVSGRSVLSVNYWKTTRWNPKRNGSCGWLSDLEFRGNRFIFTVQTQPVCYEKTDIPAECAVAVRRLRQERRRTARYGRTNPHQQPVSRTLARSGSPIIAVWLYRFSVQTSNLLTIVCF